MIPYGKHEITEEDLAAIKSLLLNDQITQGNKVPEFEKMICDNTGARYCKALNSATSALHATLLALGIKMGDLVWTSGISFVASANCALYCGAKIDFVDIDIKTYNISVEHLKEKLMEANKIGKLPKVLIVVHLTGQSCEMAEIQELCDSYGVQVIEDASHAIGGEYKIYQLEAVNIVKQLSLVSIL